MRQRPSGDEDERNGEQLTCAQNKNIAPHIFTLRRRLFDFVCLFVTENKNKTKLRKKPLGVGREIDNEYFKNLH